MKLIIFSDFVTPHKHTFSCGIIGLEVYCPALILVVREETFRKGFPIQFSHMKAIVK